LLKVVVVGSGSGSGRRKWSLEVVTSRRSRSKWYVCSRWKWHSLEVVVAAIVGSGSRLTGDCESAMYF
jgi:hypothetical protein